jgi:integrase
VREYLDAVAANHRARTRELDESTWATHLKGSTFSNIQAAAVTVADTERFIYTIRRTSESTARRVHALLRSCFNYHLERGTLQSNPAHLPKAVRLRQGHANVVPLSEEQRHKLLAYLERANPLWHALIALAIDSGARQAELFGLQWDDIDPATNTISISKTLNTIGGKAVLERETKTAKSRRKIIISSGTMDLICALPRESTQVFAHPRGRWNRSRITRIWHRVLKGADLPRYRFHDLRHTCASLLVASGAPINAISERLGHSSPMVTLNIYAHLFEDAQRPLAAIMQEKLHAKTS